MKRILLVTAYDGTEYSGFAAQKNPEIRTIEGEISKALMTLTGENPEIIGASRTDAGVHALCNYAVFDTCSPIPPENFAKALNARLPEDIRIQASWETTPDFHPRRMKSVKTYEYRIHCSRIPDPVKARYACSCYWNLDVAAMQKAAEYLVGEHDFASFANPARQTATSVREITELVIERTWCHVPDILQNMTKKPGEETMPGAEAMPAAEDAGRRRETLSVTEACDIVIRVSGKGFLYNMVRIIAGTLIRVGRGLILPEDIPEILEAQNRQAAGETAPACGLHLVNYRFAAIPPA